MFLGAGKQREHVPGVIFIPLLSYKPDKHNQNLIKHAIQNIKDGVIKMRNYCGTGDMSYKYDMWEYLCDINNNVVQASLNNIILYGVFGGGTLDISMIHFKLWEQVYFRDLTNKVGKVFMHPGVFWGFAWNV